MSIPAEAVTAEPLTFVYRNWRGIVAERRVIPQGVRWGSTEWHPEPQWLLLALDADKGEAREFAMRDILSFGRPLTTTIPHHGKIT